MSYQSHGRTYAKARPPLKSGYYSLRLRVVEADLERARQCLKLYPLDANVDADVQALAAYVGWLDGKRNKAALKDGETALPLR